MRLAHLASSNQGKLRAIHGNDAELLEGGGSRVPGIGDPFEMRGSAAGRLLEGESFAHDLRSDEDQQLCLVVLSQVAPEQLPETGDVAQ